MTNIPKKLGSCPIIEAIFEVRFEPSVASNTVFPILYGFFRHEFPNIEQILPISQMPTAVVENDQNLRFQPHYRMKHREHNNILVQVGPRVLTVNMLQPYDGWEVLSGYINRYFQLLNDAGIVSSVIRVGFRVVNFFYDDIFKKGLNLKLTINGKDIPYLDTAVKTVFQEDIYSSTVNILNSAQLNSTIGLAPKIGSVVDIDTYFTDCSQFPRNHIKYLSHIHQIEKEVFYSLFTDDYIELMEPLYE